MANHRAIVEHEGMRPYGHRAYIQHRLDQTHFDALNHGNHAHGMDGYCIDALDDIPCGSTHKVAQLQTATRIGRGLTLAEQQAGEALAQKIIQEILSEIDD